MQSLLSERAKSYASPTCEVDGEVEMIVVGSFEELSA